MRAHDVTGSTMISAPPEVVFAILADPRQHARIDGSGTVRGVVDGPDRLALGSTFGMDMKIGARYRIRNRVVEFEDGRLIAWRHFGAHRWRYELEPVAGGTRVTETWDVSHCSGPVRVALRLVGYPRRHERGIARTLGNLRAAAERDASVSA
jgi:uncharacterized protein YndB with AHSA1/START domain